MFYTYLWLREDGSPYYVGKGFKKRAFRKLTHRFSPPPKSRIILQYWPDEATAFAYEMYLIDFWGRKDLGAGCLKNLTDGGEGNTGNKPSAATLQKLKDSHLGQKAWNVGTAKGIYKRESSWGISWRVCLWSEGKLKHYGTFHIKADAEDHLAELRRGHARS